MPMEYLDTGSPPSSLASEWLKNSLAVACNSWYRREPSISPWMTPERLPSISMVYRHEIAFYFSVRKTSNTTPYLKVSLFRQARDKPSPLLLCWGCGLSSSSHTHSAITAQKYFDPASLPKWVTWRFGLKPPPTHTHTPVWLLVGDAC